MSLSFAESERRFPTTAPTEKETMDGLQADVLRLRADNVKDIRDWKRDRLSQIVDYHLYMMGSYDADEIAAAEWDLEIINEMLEPGYRSSLVPNVLAEREAQCQAISEAELADIAADVR